MISGRGRASNGTKRQRTKNAAAVPLFRDRKSRVYRANRRPEHRVASRRRHNGRVKCHACTNGTERNTNLYSIQSRSRRVTTRLRRRTEFAEHPQCILRLLFSRPSQFVIFHIYQRISRYVIITEYNLAVVRFFSHCFERTDACFEAYRIAHDKTCRKEINKIRPLPALCGSREKKSENSFDRVIFLLQIRTCTARKMRRPR